MVIHLLQLYNIALFNPFTTIGSYILQAYLKRYTPYNIFLSGLILVNFLHKLALHMRIPKHNLGTIIYDVVKTYFGNFSPRVKRG